MDTTPKTKYVEASDGVRLAYRVTGDGPDVVWQTGFAYPIDLLWDEPGFAYVVKRLRGFCRMIWSETRGGGASGGRKQDLYDEEFFVDDLTSLLNALECGQVALVGTDHVGPQVISYAARHPERIRALILINTHAHYVQETDYPVGVPREELETILSRFGQRWGAGAMVESLAPSRIGDGSFMERLARYERLSVSPDVLIEVSRRALMQDARHVLSTLSVPTLVLYRVDTRFPSVDAGRYLAEHIPGAKYVELPGADHFFWVGDVDGLLDEIEEFLTGGHQGPEGDVLTMTVLFTDIVSSTEQSALLGHRRWSRIAEDHDAMVRSTLQRYRGREIKTTGDGFLATFDATTRAVRAAMDIVGQAKAIGIEVRAGVHIGEIEFRADDVAGLPVSIAKRICDLAGPGEVLVSRPVADLVAGAAIDFSERGQHQLRGLAGYWNLFAVMG